MINNPYIIGIVFALALVYTSIIMSICRKLVAGVIFLVYIGGLIILLRYCVMLLPNNKFKLPSLMYVLVLLSINVALDMQRTYSLGLLYSTRAILLVALLLFMVLLTVVEIIGYSSGMIYDKFCVICGY